MIKFSFRHVFNIGAVAVFAVAVIMALGYNRSAALMPLLIGIPILILAVLQTVLDLRADLTAKGAAGKEQEPGAAEEARRVFSKEVNVSLWVLGMFVAIYLFGFLSTTFFYTLLSLKVRSGFPWKASLGVALGGWAFLYFLMVQLLQVDLYAGLVVIAARKALLGY